jgi:16S rRNA G966 N2-methylase RsmD
VDSDKRSLELAKQNALHCGVISASFFIAADVARLPIAREPAALVLIDAPYAKPLLTPAYDSLRAQGWLMEGTLLVAEQPRGMDAPELLGTERIDSRQYGKTMVHIYRVLGEQKG